MASDVQPKAPYGSLQKPPPREKKQPQGLKRSALPMRQTPLAGPTKPINQRGKAFKGRADDKKALLKRDPANHEGYHRCYIGGEMTKTVDLEHVIDASARPDLANHPANHKKACNGHNIAKKNGTLTMAEEIRVQEAIEQVIFETEGEA